VYALTINPLTLSKAAQKAAASKGRDSCAAAGGPSTVPTEAPQPVGASE
jgi:hypothetical protein